MASASVRTAVNETAREARSPRTAARMSSARPLPNPAPMRRDHHHAEPDAAEQGAEEQPPRSPHDQRRQQRERVDPQAADPVARTRAQIDACETTTHTARA